MMNANSVRWQAAAEEMYSFAAACFLFNRKLRFLLNKNAPQGGALRAKEYGC